MPVWQSCEFDQHEQICCFTDTATGLRAIVAIHSTTLGPAAGGTRFWPYADDRLALDDALRLSRAMSYKCALAGVPLGGGKAVLIGDPARVKNRALLHAYGRFLNRIGSSFATGEDVGFSVADCEAIREVSPYVGGTVSAGAGDPSIHTAHGIVHGMQAVLKQRFNGAGFADLRFAVQGLGNVGLHLCERLHQAGATLVVADIDAAKCEQARTRFGATVVASDQIHRADVDVFSPCALGGILTETTVAQLRAKAVAGAANNQLQTTAAGEALHARGILFAPDYVLNAGGVIGALEEVARMPGRSVPIARSLDARLRAIEDRLTDIFVRAARDGKTPEATALRLANELIGR